MNGNIFLLGCSWKNTPTLFQTRRAIVSCLLFNSRSLRVKGSTRMSIILLEPFTRRWSCENTQNIYKTLCRNFSDGIPRNRFFLSLSSNISLFLLLSSHSREGKENPSKHLKFLLCAILFNQDEINFCHGNKNCLTNIKSASKRIRRERN